MLKTSEFDQLDLAATSLNGPNPSVFRCPYHRATDVYKWMTLTELCTDEEITTGSTPEQTQLRLRLITLQTRPAQPKLRLTLGSNLGLKTLE